MHKRLLALLFFCITPALTHASLSIQVEPLAFFQKGYDLEIALKLYHWRYAVSVSKTRSPELISEEGNFDIESKVLGAHLDYFISDADGPGYGLYLGPSFHRVRWMFFHSTTGTRRRRETDFIGPQLGYVYRPSAKATFFAQFALAYEKNIMSKSDITVSGETNEIPDQVIIPSVVFGISF
jgi:hypothetical protein